MKPRLLLRLAILLFGRLAQAGQSEADSFFREKVFPLLESRCISCHGAEKVKGALRLDSREAILKGGDSGPSAVPGKPQESLMLHAVMHTKEDLGMPPKETLSRQDITVLEKWIQDGLPWPTQTKARASQHPDAERIGDMWTDPRNPIRRIFGGQRLDLWSLKPIQKQRPPTVTRRGWVRNPVDQFILHELEAKGLRPSPEADRRTLARRLWMDLTGLPPTPPEMDAYLSDTSKDAYTKLVERLLASPRYGENWARMWLDVVRYSDSNGFDWDEFRPKAWRFRDYVIRSFNKDKPYDQFVREQLAGDELLSSEPRNQDEQDTLVATGYLRLGPWDNSAALFNEQGRSRAELMADLTETTGNAFLGLTLGCARCHDHKFDPISQADHFRMRAFFEQVKFADSFPMGLREEQVLINQRNAEIDSKIAISHAERDALFAPVRARLREERLGKLTDEEKAILTPSVTNSTISAEARDKIEKTLRATDEEVKKALAGDDQKRLESTEKTLSELNLSKLKHKTGLLMSDAEGTPPVTKILAGGDYKQERQPVDPGFLSALDPNPATIARKPNPKTTGRRLALADWLVSPTNPLTARVFVNRIWQGHFTHGLVDTPNDFGLVGLRPTHPELLDWLSARFISEGWSVKKLHRLIVTSATYRQSSSPEGEFARRSRGVDADNHLLWKQNLRRLSAEQLRDSLLAVSGMLLAEGGGPARWPELPAEILQANPAILDDNAEKTKGWYPSPRDQMPVRSIYLVQKRGLRLPFMETFDQPENATSCPIRSRSVVAPQALTLLNNSEVLETAAKLAERVKREAGNDPERQIAQAFRIAFQRSPDNSEVQSCLSLMKNRSLMEVCRALVNANEFIYFD